MLDCSGNAAIDTLMMMTATMPKRIETETATYGQLNYPYKLKNGMKSRFAQMHLYSDYDSAVLSFESSERGCALAAAL